MNDAIPSVISKQNTWDILESLFFQICELREQEYQAFFDEHQVDDELQNLLIKMVRNSKQAHTLFEMGKVSSYVKTTKISDAHDWIGQQLGEYSVTGVLGEGGAAIVLKAHQNEPAERDVAIKMIYRNAPKSFFDRFYLEQSSLAKLNHPNVATIFAAGETEDEQPYLVMEYVEGLTLFEHCDHYQLSIEQRLQLFAQICSGISYSHQHGILHRDIKSENILVRTLNGVDIPLIIDFGIALELSAFATSNAYDLKIGTPEYMSPEHLYDARESDVRSEIYSLGMLLLGLLVGMPLFPREKFHRLSLSEKQELLSAYHPVSVSTHFARLSAKQRQEVANKRNISVNELTKKISNELDWIYQKATASDAEDRYASVLQLEDEINRYFEKKPVAAAGDSKRYLFKKFIQRNALLSVSVFTVFVFAIVFSAITWLQRQEIEKQFQIAQEQRAEAENQRQIALTEKETAQQINSLLEDIFTEANPRTTSLSTSTDDLSVTDILDRGLEKLKGDEELVPEVKYPLMLTLANAYLGSGKFDTSVEVLEQILKREQGEDDAIDARAHWLLARSYNLTLEHEKSLEHAQLAYQLAQSSELDEKQTIAILIRLADSYSMNGQSDAAFKHLETASSLADSINDTENKVVIAVQQGAILVKTSRLQEAITVLRSALEDTQQFPDGNKEDYVKSILLADLGRALVTLNQYDEGIAHMENSLELTRNIVGEEHVSYLYRLADLSSYYSSAGRYEDAIGINEQLVSISRENYGTEDQRTLRFIWQSAWNLSQFGSYKQSNALFLDVLRISKENNPDRPYTQLKTGIAQNYLGMGELINAKSYIDDALSAFEGESAKTNIGYWSIVLFAALIDAQMGEYSAALQNAQQAQKNLASMLNEEHKIMLIADIALTYSQFKLDKDAQSLEAFTNFANSYLSRTDKERVLEDLFTDWISAEN